MLLSHTARTPYNHPHEHPRVSHVRHDRELWLRPLVFSRPQGAANVYGFGAAATDLSNTLFQFMGILFFAEGVMCAVARQAEASVGRTAVLAFICVSSLLCFFMDIRTLPGEPGTMDYVDTVINALFGFGALAYILKDRKVAATGTQQRGQTL